MDAETTTLSLIARAYFSGLEPEEVVERTRLGRRLVLHRLERLEAVMLLIAHGFPRPLIGRVAHLKPEEAEAYANEILGRLGDAAGVAAFLSSRAERLMRECPRGNGDDGGTAPSPTDREETVDQALEVLDFWASKWL